MSLTAEDLLAGARATYEIAVPASVLDPSGASDGDGATVTLRPLTVADIQLLTRAAADGDSLLATLMVQRALVEPEMSVAQVAGMHAGLVDYLLDHVNRISGISAAEDQFATAADAPIAKAAFVLADEFGWTPEQVGEMTLGQVMLHLEMLARRNG